MVKCKAPSLEDAEAQVQSDLEESCSEGNSAGWDYVGEVKHVTDEEIKAEFGSKKKMEENWKKATEENYQNFIGLLDDKLFYLLAPKYMPLEEAPLNINRKSHYGDEDKEAVNIVEKILKGDGGKLPASFEEFHRAVLDTVVSLAKDYMPEYYIRQIHAIEQYRRCPTDKYTSLYNTNIHFADVTPEEWKKHKAYYFITDRHC